MVFLCCVGRLPQKNFFYIYKHKYINVYKVKDSYISMNYKGGYNTMEKQTHHNIVLDEKSEKILNNQARDFNFSKFIREALIAMDDDLPKFVPANKL